MTKTDFVTQMEEFGDAYVYYKNNAGRERFLVGTLDFSTPYIKAKKQQPLELPNAILVFCWDTNKFKQVRLDRVFKLVPLSSVLNNDKDDDTI